MDDGYTSCRYCSSAVATITFATPASWTDGEPSAGVGGGGGRARDRTVYRPTFRGAEGASVPAAAERRRLAECPPGGTSPRPETARNGGQTLIPEIVTVTNM